MYMWCAQQQWLTRVSTGPKVTQAEWVSGLAWKLPCSFLLGWTWKMRLGCRSQLATWSLGMKWIQMEIAPRHQRKVNLFELSSESSCAWNQHNTKMFCFRSQRIPFLLKQVGFAFSVAHYWREAFSLTPRMCQRGQNIQASISSSLMKRKWI